MSRQNPFKYYKTSPEIIKLAVMYYIRYPLSLRQVEDILHERGIDICHETMRYWWNKFGSMKSLQKFISMQSVFQNHFNHQRHLENRDNFKNLRQNSIDQWRTICVK